MFGSEENYRNQLAELREALALLYDKWENGTPCFEDPEDHAGSLGNAFKLEYEEENKILELLKGYDAQR